MEELSSLCQEEDEEEEDSSEDNPGVVSSTLPSKEPLTTTQPSPEAGSAVSDAALVIQILGLLWQQTQQQRQSPIIPDDDLNHLQQSPLWGALQLLSPLLDATTTGDGQTPPNDNEMRSQQDPQLWIMLQLVQTLASHNNNNPHL